MQLFGMGRFLRVGFIVLLSLISISPTFAAKPNVIVIPINDTFTFEACGGLTITQTITGNVRIMERIDHNGNLVMQTDHVHLHGSFANTATGITLPFVVAVTDKVSFHHDGSVTVATTGLIGRITVPKQGLVTADVGRIIVRYSEDGAEVLFEAGRHDNGPFPYICPFLVP